MKTLCLLLLSLSAAFAGEENVQHRITGLFSPQREAALRTAMEKLPGVKLVSVDFEHAEVVFAYDAAVVFKGAKPEQVVVIDSDLGRSGACAVDREGFQRLVTEVGLGRAGIVMGLEVSRLARNNADWHRLLEICSLTGTLIVDADGCYDPADFNRRERRSR